MSCRNSGLHTSSFSLSLAYTAALQLIDQKKNHYEESLLIASNEEFP